jgi:hypothetical protein
MFVWHYLSVLVLTISAGAMALIIDNRILMRSKAERMSEGHFDPDICSLVFRNEFTEVPTIEEFSFDRLLNSISR